MERSDGWNPRTAAEDEAILNNVLQHHNLVKSLANEYGYKYVIMTSLVGSQNYQLDTPDSDIDTCSFVFPDLLSFVKNDALVSFERECDDGKIVVKDIRLALNLLRKPSPNSIEWFITSYQIVEPMFSDIITDYLNNKRVLYYMTHCNYMNMLNAIVGLSNQLPKRNMPCGKMYSHVIRLRQMFHNYINLANPSTYLEISVGDLEEAKAAKEGRLDKDDEWFVHAAEHTFDLLKHNAEAYHESALFERNKEVEQLGQYYVDQFQLALFDRYYAYAKREVENANSYKRN